MPENNLFEYAVIRVVPRVEREEFVNVGVILFCARLKFLQCICSVDQGRLLALSAKIDMDELKEHLHAFGNICRGDESGGPIAQLDQASRFRWLSATRSTIVQTSKTHPGLSNDPQKTLDKLFNQLVL